MPPAALVHVTIPPPFGDVADGAVLIDRGAIAWIGAAAAAPLGADVERIDGRGALVVPGFIDLQTHGGAGYDFLDARPEEIARILEWLPSTGASGVLATTTTAPEPALHEALGRLADAVESRGAGARILGIHLEGPFIAHAQRGAQPAEAIRPPDVDEFERLQERARGHIRLVTLAPEIPGALKLIGHLRGRGIVAAAAHSDATYDQMRWAVDAGLCHVSHCFNAMRGFHHREPGVVGAALALRELTADVILDGHHVHPAAAAVLLAAKGAAHVGLITDATQAAGLPEGEYVRPGGRRIVVRDGAARLENGALAGSVLTMAAAVGNAARWLELDLGAAAAMAGRFAARRLGLAPRKGTLQVGADADLCVLGPDGTVWTAIVGGRIAFRAGDPGEREGAGDGRRAHPH